MYSHWCTACRSHVLCYLCQSFPLECRRSTNWTQGAAKNVPQSPQQKAPARYCGLHQLVTSESPDRARAKGTTYRIGMRRIHFYALTRNRKWWKPAASGLGPLSWCVIRRESVDGDEHAWLLDRGTHIVACRTFWTLPWSSCTRNVARKRFSLMLLLNT